MMLVPPNVKSPHLLAALSLQSQKSLRSTISKHSLESPHRQGIPEKSTSENTEHSFAQCAPIDVSNCLILPTFYLTKSQLILFDGVSKKLACKSILQSKSHISQRHTFKQDWSLH